MATLNDLLNTITQPQYVQYLLTRLQAAGVPTDQYKDSTMDDYAFTQVISEALADDRLSLSEIFASCYLQFASGLGLTLFAKSSFHLDRLLASPTAGTIRLLSVISAPTYNFIPGQITVGTKGTDPTIIKLYSNTTGGTLVPGGHLDLTFEATQAGSSYNIPNATALDLKTSFVGVTVSNPLNPIASNWITATGTDDESDDLLRNRCRNRWGTEGAGGNENAYLFWAFSPINGGTTSPVRRARAVANFFGNLVKPAYTTVYVTGPNGPLSTADLAAVQANFENPQKYPSGFQVLVLNAIDTVVPVIGTVYIYRKANVSPTDVQAAVEASLLDYQGTLDIGDQGIYPQKIATWIASYPARKNNVETNIDSIRNVVLSQPSTVVNLAYNAYPRLQYAGGNLSYVLV